MAKIIIDESRCKGCDICIEYCPVKVFNKSTVPNERGIYLPIPAREEDCTRLRLTKLLGREVCRFCEKMCPDFAIKVNLDDPEEEE